VLFKKWNGKISKTDEHIVALAMHFVEIFIIRLLHPIMYFASQICLEVSDFSHKDR